MEVKKSHKADLEHLRPWILIGSFLAVTLLFVGVLFIPFQSIGSMLENYFDDYSMDLDLKIDERENMISAAQKEPEKKKIEPQKIIKVDDVIEMKEEEPEPSADAEPTDEEIEEQQPINQNDDDEETRKLVEQLPEYPGGMVEFMKWLTKTLKYPDEALRSHTEGKVMVNFIVESDGSLTGLKVVQSAGKVLDAEALRVMRLMPRWQPGKDDKGRPCRTLMAIPIVFEI